MGRSSKRPEGLSIFCFTKTSKVTKTPVRVKKRVGVKTTANTPNQNAPNTSSQPPPTTRIATLSDPFNQKSSKKGGSFFSSWKEYTEGEFSSTAKSSLTTRGTERKRRCFARRPGSSRPVQRSLPDGFGLRPGGNLKWRQDEKARKHLVFNKSHRRHITCDKDKDECYRRKRVLESRLSCPYCSRHYQMEGTYRRHFISHFDARLHTCEICQTSYADTAEVRHHLKQHHHQETSCSHCHKSFANSSVLNEHLKMRHPKISSKFNCVFCQERIDLADYDKIEEHLASHSRLENDNELENLVRGHLNGVNGSVTVNMAIKEEDTHP